MAKVKTVESSAEFQLLVEKSGLLDGDKLEAARQICGTSDNPKTAARQLLKDGLLSNWQANQLLGGFFALVIGNYRLMDQIGKGELGRVYLAQHSKMGNKVALKALASKSASDPKMVERFLAEARAAGAFEHRNVVRVLDVASDQDRPFVVTEFVSGGDLQQRVDQTGPLSPREVADFLAQAAEGMAYVHGKNVLHRDLKPANVLVDNKGVVKILDVGVGHLRQTEKTGSENTGELLLSALGYMSPEQVRGKELDVRSDIYALGGTLYFVLTGRVPYTANSNEERDVIRTTKRPVPITTLKPEIPAELASLCDQMMALKPTDRPASMEAVAQRLKQFLNAVPEIVPAEPLQLAIPLVPAESNLSDTVHKIGADTVPLGATMSAAITALAIEKGSVEAANSADPSATVDDTVKIARDDVEAGPSPPADVPAGFKIQKKKKAAIDESVASTAEIDSPLAAVAEKAKRQRIILIGSAAASLLVIGLSVGVMMILSGGDEPQVAQNETARDHAAAKSNAEQAATNEPPAGLNLNDPEIVADPGSIADSQAPTNAAIGASTATVTAATPAAAANATPPATPPGTAPVNSSTTPQAALPAAAVATTTNPAVPAGTPSSAVATTLATTTGATPTTAPLPAATSAPATVPAPATTPTPAGAPSQPTAGTQPAATLPSPAATAPKTDAPKVAPATEAPTPAAPPKSPPAKSAKIFDIASSVDLPRLPASDGSAPAEAPEKVLGKININPKDTCFLAMYGGDKAMKGRNQFTLRNAKNGTAPRDWEIVQKDTTGTETVIATLAFPTQELKFEWTPDGLKNPSASALRNCAIKITTGQEKPQFVALRTATKPPPIAVENLERSSGLSAKYNLDAIPDGSALRLEPSVENQKTLFDASGPDITKGDQWIVFGEDKEKSPLALKLDTSITGKGIQITAVPHVLLPNEKPQRLTPALRKKLPLPDLQKQSTNIAGRLAEMKKLKKDDQTKIRNEMDLTELAQKNVDQLIQRVQKLDELIQQLNGGGKIHFRIFYDAGETQVDLVKTDASAPPAGK